MSCITAGTNCYGLYPSMLAPNRFKQRKARVDGRLSLLCSLVSNGGNQCALIRNPLSQIVIIRPETEAVEARQFSIDSAAGVVPSQFAGNSDEKKSDGIEPDCKNIRLPSELDQVNTRSADSIDLEEEIKKCVHRLHRLCTMRPASYLATLMGDFRAGLHRSNINSMFFTSEPAASALSKRRFQVASILWSAYFLYWSVWYSFLVNSVNLFVPNQINQTFKFTWLDSRVIEEENSKWFKFQFGFLQNGCKLHIPNSTTRIENGTTAFLTFPIHADIKANGYFVSVSNCSIKTCPSKWSLEAYVQDTDRWEMTSASTWRFDSGTGKPVLYPSVPSWQKIEKGSEIRINLDLDWKWYIQYLGVVSVCALGWLLISLSALCKRERSAVSFWIGYLVVLAIMFLILAASNWSDGNWREALVDWLWILPVLTLAAGVQFNQKLLIYHMLLYGLLQIMGKIVEGIVFPSSTTELLNGVLVSTGFIVVLACLILLWLRMRVMKKSRQLVQTDRIFYDNLWSEILLKIETMSDLMRLKELVDKIRNEAGAPAPSQTLRRFHTMTRSRRSIARLSIQSLQSMVTSVESLSGTSVESLDQLYFQAHCLHPVLLDRVKKWASASSGLFPVRCDGRCDDEKSVYTYMKWAEIERDPTIANRVSWAKIKSVERAIEKIDVSKLIDICRQSIVFETISDLTACLLAIAEDSDTRILRIKNRLDPEYNSALSAGYRDVCVNLRFSNYFAESWGLERHICEVQLVLLPYATLKSEEGHKRYVQFRNLRGE